MKILAHYLAIIVFLASAPGFGGDCSETVTRAIEIMRILNFSKETGAIAANQSPLSPAFQRYRRVTTLGATQPMRGGSLQFKPGMENGTYGITLDEANAYVRQLDNIMAERDQWIAFNLIIAETIRERTSRMAGDNKQLEAIRTVLMETAVALGFPASYSVTPGDDPDDPFDDSFTFENFRKMLAEGLPFMDRAFEGRGGQTAKHTSVVHFLQILFAESMLQNNVTTGGRIDRRHHMGDILRRLLGNHKFAEATTGNFVSIRPPGGYRGPWYNLFDAEGADAQQVYVPEWFGAIWHEIHPDIDYDLFLNAIPVHYGAAHKVHPFPTWNAPP